LWFLASFARRTREPGRSGTTAVASAKLAGMAHAVQLCQTPLVSVERVEHAVNRLENDPGDDCAERYSINFIERGTFALQLRGQRWTIGQQEIFLTTPGMEYRCREVGRPDHAGDGVCLDVAFSELARDAFEGRSVKALRSHAPVIGLNNRRAYLRRRLSSHVAHGASRLAIDIVAGEVLHSALMASKSIERRFKSSQLDWYARRIDEARQLLDNDYAADHALAGLARAAGMSAYHFARIFRELTGQPPHRYLLRRRLEAAAARLCDGASVTDTCYAVGFGSLSHFIHAFRAAYGAPPSRWRPTGDSGKHAGPTLG
jgi:AraC family transcriptional regulator